MDSNPLSPPASPQLKQFHSEPLQSSFSVAALLGDKLLPKQTLNSHHKKHDDTDSNLPPTPQPSDTEEDEQQPPRKRQCNEQPQCELAKLLLDGTPPPSPEPARVSVIMRANRDGTCSPANFTVTPKPVTESPPIVVVIPSNTAQTQRKTHSPTRKHIEEFKIQNEFTQRGNNCE